MCLDCPATRRYNCNRIGHKQDIGFIALNLVYGYVIVQVWTCFQAAAKCYFQEKRAVCKSLLRVIHFGSWNDMHLKRERDFALQGRLLSLGVLFLCLVHIWHLMLWCDWVTGRWLPQNMCEDSRVPNPPSPNNCSVAAMWKKFGGWVGIPLNAD